MGTGSKIVNDGLVESVTLYRSYFWLLRWDVLPFAMLYSVLFAASFSNDTNLRIVGFICLPIALSVHLLLFLLSQWSISLQCKLGNYLVKDVNQAELVHVKTALNAGNDRIVQLTRRSRKRDDDVQQFVTIAGNKYLVPSEYFVFQKVTYSYDADKNTFLRLEYPTAARLMSLLKSTGHASQSDVSVSTQKWGRNEFDIPVPTFFDLYAEHMVAPFFVFQVICLFLWSLDDYWYYSVCTLVLLMFFEGMLCRQRQASLLMLRNMRRPPVAMYVLRRGQWGEVSSEDLVPGDVVSLKAHVPKKPRRRRHDEYEEPEPLVVVVPCDVILLRGTCVTNEAMLTGESVPQVKESLALVDQEQLGLFNRTDEKGVSDGYVDLGSDNSVDPTWRRHMVFGGTNILQHTDKNEGDSYSDGSSKDASDVSSATESFASRARSALSGLSSPPDKGCVAFVVRTAFGTSQGGLMRKILFATERINANSAETFYFIGVLIVFAVVASSAVLREGLMDENRNKFKLALHCIMILTSVIPPELPMELSLAVTNSLAALSRGLVFCTEPFRIPYAGKLNVLCFDKTGTLTMDKMVLKGVVGVGLSDGANSEKKEKVTDSEKEGEKGGVSVMDPTQTLSYVITSTKADVTASITDSNTDDIPSTRTITTIIDPSTPACPEITLCVMAACHSLMVAPESGVVVGDPLEIATMESSGFQFISESVLNAAINGAGTASSSSGSSLCCVVHSTKGLVAKVKHRYPFSSALKRMSAIVECSIPSKGESGLFVFTKGAPEVLAAHMSDVPPFYKDTYVHHMTRGKRVLVLAYRRVVSSNAAKALQDLKDAPRSKVESGLTFAGFLVFDCDLKADSKSVIRELKNSDHQVVMITGDSAYTAADVAAKLGMLRTGPDVGLLNLEVKSAVVSKDASASAVAPELVWRKILGTAAGGKGVKVVTNSSEEIPFNSSTDALRVLALQYSLCVTGSSLASLLLTKKDESALLHALCPNVTIFARVSPAQKETIVLALNDTGLFTLMCGDGTNDVGALKAAHVGVSIVNDPDFEKRIEEAKDPSVQSAPGGKKAKGTNAKERLARAMAEVQAQEIDPTIVKLGDASIASPFTARRTSVDCVLTVMRQGRCTLVTTIQMFKVLALNCLVSAYMMSALYLRGLKQGDMQMTSSGLITAGLFFFLSQAKPLQNLSAAKPPSSVFCRSVTVSVAGQFIIHLSCLVATLALCEKHMTDEDPGMSADGKFQPNVINSAVFLLAAVMQVNNFVVNYRGHPFTQSIQENTALWRSVQVIYTALLIVAGGQLEPLNDLLQMAPFPSPIFQASLIGILLFNFGVCYGIEKFCQKYLE